MWRGFLMKVKQKSLLAIVLIVSLSLFMVACGGSKDTPPNNVETNGSAGESNTDTGNKKPVSITVGATDVPHAEILEFIKPKLADKGVTLTIKVFNEYVLPNETLAGKDLDANFFQHKPWLENYVKESGNDIIPFIGVHIEPMGGYSKTITSIDQLKDGAKVGVPNAVTELGRVLALLEANQLITLTEGVGLAGTLKDIVTNPKNLEFIEIDPSLLAPTIGEYDMAIINTNFAMQAGFVPAKDALIIEGTESPYVNVLAIRSESANDEAIKILADELLSPEVATFIEQQYEGAVVPAQVKY